MMKQFASLSLSLLFCISASVYADNGGGKNGSNAGINVLNGTTLDGSRQGASIGFVDIDGDGIADKIVGAPFATSSSNTGAVLVYKGDAMGGFSSSPSMLLSGDDNYGFSFVNPGDVDGDGKDDFVVGAINGDGPDVSLSGSVTLYQGGRNSNYNQGGGKVIAKLAGEGPMDKFGYFVAAGDLNNDGKKDLIVGAPYNTNDPALYQGGAVYIYFAPNFTKKVLLHASSLNKGLGWSGATGDINGDGIADLCISATGKVLCYYGAQNFNPSLDAPDVIIKSAGAGFGKALAVIGGEIVIGAPNAVISGKRDTGSVFIVTGGIGTRTINADTTSSDLIVRIDGSALFDRFGFSISPTGGLDFAASAPMADMDEYNRLTGKVYFFMGEDISGATTLADASFFNGVMRSSGYGSALASAQNSRLLIGAPRTDMDTGAVVMVDLTTGQDVPGGGSGGSSGGGGECP